jgi:pimeloyl-ACP methyl ester carboxylesterase
MLYYVDNKNFTPANHTIVLLHGFCENSGIWQEFDIESADKPRIICIDLPNFGKSPALLNTTHTHEISIENMADAVHELLQHLEISDCAMFGHSLGGYVTLAFADKYPKMLKGIGLINSTVYADSEEKKQNRNKLIESLETYGTKPFLSTFFTNLFYEKNLPKFEKELAWLQNEAQNLTTETLIQTTKAMRDRKDYTALLQNLDIPVLFIVGKHDTILPYELHKEQFLLPKEATIQVGEEVGHLSMFEAKDQTFAAMLNFSLCCYDKV